MILQKLLDVERYLAGRGIVLTVERQPPVGVQAVKEAEQAIGHAMPWDMKQFYVGFADGVKISWDDSCSKSQWNFGRLVLPSLEDLVLRYEQFHRETAAQYDNADEYFDNVSAARGVLALMMHWAVLWDTGGDGNLVCIDLTSGRVVFHEREWSFYDPAENGKLIAPSLNQLIDDWGNVCFLEFPGCPGNCPPPGQSAVPDYSQQEYRLSGLR